MTVAHGRTISVKVQRSATKVRGRWGGPPALPPNLVPSTLVDTMQLFRRVLGDGNMMAYLSMMAVRLVEMKRLLRETGTLYLHCDPTASHYLKIVLDALFGADHFENEVIWQRSTGKSL